MRYIDISLPVSESTVHWPGDPPVRISPLLSLEQGDGANVSEIRLSSHAGTHVDAPLHLVAGGASVDALPLAALIGPALVVEIPAVAVITPAELEALALPTDCRRLLLRTANSTRRLLAGDTFAPDFAALSGDAGAWLAERSMLLVGIDAPSVDPLAEEALPAHLALLRAGVVIIEGLSLAGVAPGPCTLYCLPLKVAGGDGAPARVILGYEQDAPV